MSPLVASPNRGYSDWQRVENYDSGVLFSRTNFGPVSSDTSGILDVSRFAYIGGFASCTVQPVSLEFTWFADVAGTVQLGQRIIVLDPLIVNPAQLRIANLGPFLRADWSEVGGVTFTHSCRLFPTNRVHPLELIPASTVLLSAGPFSIATGASQFFYLTDYYSGPALIWCFTNGLAITFTLEALGGNGTWFDIWQNAGQSVFNSQVITVPPASCRIEVDNNTGTNGTGLVLALTHSYTGGI